MKFQRFRHLRSDQSIRDSHSEVSLCPEDFIQPFFVVDGSGIRNPMPSLSNVFHLSVDELLKDVAYLQTLGVNKVLLFGAVEPHLYDDIGSYSSHEHNPVPLAVKTIKKHCPGVTVMTDICICGYTSHGHCGFVKGNAILNDESLKQLAQMALTHAQAGADYVAPSAMMDGQVLAIRHQLNLHGLKHVHIMAYAAKYASAFYGPFRNAVDSTPSFGDRRTYQMDPRNGSQAIEEVRADIEEGATAVMVKPGHTYLDILYRIHQEFPHSPLAVYHVSGEYMMIHHAVEAGALDLHPAIQEVFYSFKRAGANWIITYDSLRYWQHEGHSS